MTQEAAATLELMLGLHRDLSGFYKLAGHDAKLDALAGRFKGVKPARFPTLFEGFVNAIACQQLMLTFGIQLINRLVGAFGLPLSKKEGGLRAEELEELDDVSALRSLCALKGIGRWSAVLIHVNRTGERP